MARKAGIRTEPNPSSACLGVGAKKLREGRDRQVRGAGYAESMEPANSAVAPAYKGCSFEGIAWRKSQPARLLLYHPAGGFRVYPSAKQDSCLALALRGVWSTVNGPTPERSAVRKRPRPPRWPS